MTHFQLGDRVRVQDHEWPTFWANGVSGTISLPPQAVSKLAEGWSGHVRMVRTTSGMRPYYWVTLDEARMDGEGDGPYREAEIGGDSLHLLVDN